MRHTGVFRVFVECVGRTEVKSKEGAASGVEGAATLFSRNEKPPGHWVMHIGFEEIGFEVCISLGLLKSDRRAGSHSSGPQTSKRRVSE